MAPKVLHGAHIIEIIIITIQKRVNKKTESKDG